MKIDEILNLDYRKKVNRIEIQNVLRKIKPLSKYEEGTKVKLEDLEKLLKVLISKYKVKPQWINFNHFEKVNCVYNCSIISDDGKGKWLGNVYGCCIYELFAKLIIKIYSDVKNGTIDKRE